MERKQIEAYDFYKNEYPGTLLFFHVKDRYVVLSDDSSRVAKLLDQNVGESSELSFKDDDMSIFKTLGDFDIQIRLIDYRNDNGEFDYPDIKLIKKEKQDDY